MYRRWFVVYCLLTLFVVVPTRAQPASPSSTEEPHPLVYMAEGRLWAFDLASRSVYPLTASAPRVVAFAHHPYEPFAAVVMRAAIADEAIEREGSIGGGHLPSDVAVISTVTTPEPPLSPVGEQPPDASFFTPNQPDRFHASGYPVWSPDGTRLA